MRRRTNRMVLVASITEDIKDLDTLYAFGELAYAEYLNAVKQMQFRLELALEGKEVWEV